MSGHMSRQQPPVEQVVEACEEHHEKKKPLCCQVPTCDSDISQHLANMFNRNQSTNTAMTWLTGI